MNRRIRLGLYSFVAATIAFTALLNTVDAWAAPRQKKSTGKTIPPNQVLKPGLEKPFEGGWRFLHRKQE